MQPEEKLQKQSAIARHQAQTQKVKRYKSKDAKFRVSPSSATVIGYNAAIGANLIQLPDGSITYAKSDTNGAIALGESAPLHSATMAIDGLPYIKKQPVVVKKPLIKTAVSTFKILFSVIEDNIQKFYVGGDRSTPELIFELDPNLYSGAIGDDPNNPYESLHIGGFIANTGAGVDDWVVGIRYSQYGGFFQGDIHYLTVITPQSTITFSDENEETRGIGSLSWKGAGIWSTDARFAFSLNDYNFSIFGATQSETTTTLFFQTSRGPTPPSTLQVVNPSPWYANNDITVPFPAGANYLFNKEDHVGLRAVPPQFENNFNTQETWNLTQNNLNGVVYTAPPPSYQQGETFLYPESLIDRYLSLRNVNNASRNGYMVGEISDYFLRGLTYSIVGSNAGREVIGSGANLTSVEALRSHLSISTDLKSRISTLNTLPGFVVRATYANFSGRRIGGTVYTDRQNWSRLVNLTDIKGTTYLMPDVPAMTESSSYMNSDVMHDEEFSFNYEQNYLNSVAIIPSTGALVQNCETITSTYYYYPQIPTTTSYSIYDKSTGTLYPLISTEESLKFDHRLDTFLIAKGGGYKRVYFNELPSTLTENKTEKVTVKVDNFKRNGNLYNLQKGKDISVKVFSLNIDKTLEHRIHNLSYFEAK